MKTNKTVYILRGLPGSGKSTVAELLLWGANREGRRGEIYSTDYYFEDSQGNYKFDPDKLGEYHDKNFEDFCYGLKSGREVLIVDNTNTRHWEYQRYLDAAKEAGAFIQVVTVGSPKDPNHVRECAARNSHGVPLEAIRRMSDRFEV